MVSGSRHTGCVACALKACHQSTSSTAANVWSLESLMHKLLNGLLTKSICNAAHCETSVPAVRVTGIGVRQDKEQVTDLVIDHTPGVRDQGVVKAWFPVQGAAKV